MNNTKFTCTPLPWQQTASVGVINARRVISTGICGYQLTVDRLWLRSWEGSPEAEIE